MNEWVPWVPTIGAAILAIIAGIIAIYNRRGGEKAKQLPTYEEYAAENRALRADLNDADGPGYRVASPVASGIEKDDPPSLRI